MEEKQRQEYYSNSWKNWTEIFPAFGANSRALGAVTREKYDQQEYWRTR